MTDLAGGFVPLVRKPDPEPWAAPGLTVAQRAAAFTDDPGLARDVAAALRASIEDAALLVEAMAFDAVAARIRRLKEDDRG